MLREPTVAGIGQLAAMQTRGAVIWGRPPCSGPARPEHRPAAASQRSLQVCIASLPLQSSLMSKTYLKSDHFDGGGSQPPPLWAAPRPIAAIYYASDPPLTAQDVVFLVMM